jgi:prepilin-type processing-associated H-X9-DG protein/prepilin-type N-terminal cleavage/methylation domain-containing protein
MRMNKRRTNCKVIELLSHFLVPDAASAFRQIKNGRSCAFTLLELLVVMAMIALLAALLFPAISRSKQKAQQIKCVSNLHQLGIALQNFIADNQTYPSGMSGFSTDGSESWLGQRTWVGQLEHGGFGISKPITTNYLAMGVVRCPSDPSDRPLSYGYNGYGVRDQGTNTGFGLLGRFIFSSGFHAPLPESEVVSPSQMMAIGDTFGGAIFFGPRDWPDGPLPIWNEHLHFILERHQGRLDVVFCDGHVESPTVGFLFTNTTDAALVRWNRDHLPHRDQL